MIDHPTTKVGDEDDYEDLEVIEGVVRVDEESGRYELLALEYDDSLVPGETALSLYEADITVLYEDVHGNNAFDVGDYTWDEMSEVLGG